MADVPDTVREALEEVPVEGATCLEAGAGAGNATAALRERSAAQVFAITNDTEHAATVCERFRDDDAMATIRAELRSIPLPDDSIDVVTAHALFNVVSTTEAAAIVDELTRVATPGGWLVVDDYAPIPSKSVRKLFAVANAVGELTERRPTFTFYPRDHLRALFEARGWGHVRTKPLLEPVPWTAELLDTHLELLVERTSGLPDDIATPLREHARTVRERAGGGVETGEMYSLAFRLDGG